MTGRMRSSNLLLVLALTMWLVQLALAQQVKGTARVSGRVTRTDTGAPVPDALVRLSAPTGVAVKNATSAQSGQFEFTDVAAGEYRVTANAPGLVSADATPAQQLGAGKLIKLNEGQEIRNLELTVARMSAIEGRVLDPADEPVADVPVSLAQLRYMRDKPMLVQIGPSKAGRTDAEGRYRFVDLLPGDYYVLATAGSFVSAAPNGSTMPSNKLLGYVPTYFPGTDSMLGARPVRVEVGVDAFDVTFSLVPASVVAMSGAVSDANGRPVPDAKLLLIRTEGGELRGDAAALTTSDAGGKFAYRAIPSGTYVLQAIVSGGFGSRPIDVPAIKDELTGIELTIRPRVTARGHVSFEGGPPPAQNLVTVTFVPTDFTSGPAGSTALMAKLRDDSTFEITDLAWIGLLRARVPSGWALKSVMLNGRDIADLPSDFQSADVNGLELIMTNHLAAISGTVTDGNQPAVSSPVFVFPEDQTKMITPSRFINATRTDSRGEFNLTGVLPGRYQIIAVPMPIRFSVEWLMSLKAFASPVVVSDDEAKTVSLKLVKR